MDPCLNWRLLDTRRKVCLSLLWGHCSFLLGLGVHKVLFVPSKSLFLQSHGSSVIKSHWPTNQIACGSQSLCQISWLRNLLWAPELLQQCENFFAIIVLQFVGHLVVVANNATITLISHASKVMLKILQARLQQYVNQELPDVHAVFRKGRGIRNQIANIY